MTLRMSNWEHFVWWKKHLLSDLDNGVLEQEEWGRFIREAYKAGMACMAIDMQKRLSHYIGGKNE